MTTDNCFDCGKPLGSTTIKCFECGGENDRPKAAGPHQWQILLGVKHDLLKSLNYESRRIDSPEHHAHHAHRGGVSE